MTSKGEDRPINSRELVIGNCLSCGSCDSCDSVRRTMRLAGEASKRSAHEVVMLRDA